LRRRAYRQNRFKLTKILLKQAIEDHLLQLYLKTLRNPYSSFIREQHMSWIPEQESVWPNVIMKARLAKSEMDEHIQNVLQKIKAGDLPRTWVVGPSTVPARLGKHLEKYGFQKDERSGMALDFNKCKTLAEEPKDIDVQVVQDQILLQDWMDTVFQHRFRQQENITHSGFEQVMRRLLHDPQVTFYIAYQNRRPVSTCMLVFAGGVAGLHCLSKEDNTDDSNVALHAVLSAAVNGALLLGYRYAVVESKEEYKPHFKRLGFKQICTINHYVWQPTE
jgi:hypothetical protein